MSKNSNTLPPKGILRNSHSSKKDNAKDKCSLPTTGAGTLLDEGRARFDEMNILETHHPGVYLWICSKYNLICYSTFSSKIIIKYFIHRGQRLRPHEN